LKIFRQEKPHLKSRESWAKRTPLYAQFEIESAIAKNDQEAILTLLSDNIIDHLRSELDPILQLRMELLPHDQKKDLKHLMFKAFVHGWMHNGAPNLSNALEEVLITVQDFLRKT
jgi:hypothetical protein